MNNVFISIGSNLGDKIGNCRVAVEELAKFSKVNKLSSLYETEPVGKEDQPNFINTAVEIETNLSAQELLIYLKSIEEKMGRVRTEKWGPRTIDLDIIFYGELVIKNDDLAIPHPRAHLRRFVLEPICEIAPNYIHPVLNKTVGVLIKECEDNKQVIKLDEKFTILQQ
ncbi:MAG: 2-amino-4-hydroxy-6-hydroxymethyldihydropteridine diphosphokinase [Thermodesulfobacteriota bacterium]|jgi:2-amino-4-hydroxy-6-hydroxymethyldihydropteridine diphosphokinase